MIENTSLEYESGKIRRSRAKISQLFWIHRGQESAWILSRELSNHLIPRWNSRRMRVSVSLPTLLSSFLPLLWKSALEWPDLVPVSTQCLDAFRIVYMHCVPRKTQEEQETSKRVPEMIIVRREYAKFSRVETRSTSLFRAFRKLSEPSSLFENELRRRMSSFSNGWTSKLFRIIINIFV